MISRVNKSELFASLPAPWPQDLLPEIRAAVAASRRKLVVLDDDPTGTQTVYDLPVLTTWDVAALRAELANDTPCFYILTNSRSLSTQDAYALNLKIAHNLKAAAVEIGVDFSIVSRGDSTLRGHFPGEPQALTEALGGFDAIIVIPYFEAGGRYTVGDVHYVAEGDTLVPAAETPFARDAAFGYRSSNLREWVAEKFGGEISAASVASISINDLRIGGAKAVCEKLLQAGFGNICVVNAACPRDLEVFVQGLLAAEAEGRRFLFRTAASFVAARLGLAARPLWQPNFDSINWNADELIAAKRPGGLIIVGSHVSKTTAQLEALEKATQIVVWKLNAALLLNETDREQAIADVVFKAEFACRRGADVVIATSRELIAGSDATGSLEIGAKISAALVEVVQRLKVRPRYLIAKGGITASDLATRGLGVKRAMVLGQILPGVPVWELGTETKFPGLPYIVFPGNVGGRDALKEAVEKLK
jgi:uncharacterized protein YgbK (DUF1537 family)